MRLSRYSAATSKSNWSTQLRSRWTNSKSTTVPSWATFSAIASRSPRSTRSRLRGSVPPPSNLITCRRWPRARRATASCHRSSRPAWPSLRSEVLTTAARVSCRTGAQTHCASETSSVSSTLPRTLSQSSISMIHWRRRNAAPTLTFTSTAWSSSRATISPASSSRAALPRTTCRSRSSAPSPARI